MIHKTLLKVVSCGAGGAWILAAVAYVVVWNEHAEFLKSMVRSEFLREDVVVSAFELNDYAKETVLVGAIIGAVIGLIGGVGWAIEHNEARWRFIGWTVGGCIIGLVVHENTENGWFMLLGMLGAVIGGVTALESAGYFDKKGRNR